MRTTKCFSRASALLALAFLCTIAAAAMAGGRRCSRCGAIDDVRSVCQLVKVSREAAMPQYAGLKREVFIREKGAVCHKLYRCDTRYDFWRASESKQRRDKASEGTFQSDYKSTIAPLHSSCSTDCGCQTHWGAKPTGCHEHRAVRTAVGHETVTSPILKWETIFLCDKCRTPKTKRR